MLGAPSTTSFVAAATNEITQPFEGVRLIHSKSTVPRLVDIWVVEIDMKAPGLAFRTSPSNGDLVGEVTPQTVRAFVTKIGAQLGVNASFFASAGEGQFKVLGLSASNGDAYSEFEAPYVDALNVSARNVATIIRAKGKNGKAHRPNVPLNNAVGGNTRLVTDGVSVAKNLPAIHPRTAAGVTADGKLLLVTVDGREKGHSLGLTYRELADVLIGWGARQAINLDGGGSTTLVVDDPETAAHDPQVRNMPCDPFKKESGALHGKERAVANSFAVFAQAPTSATVNEFVYTDFEKGDVGAFESALSYSGSNRGIKRELSKAEVVKGIAHDGAWLQRLTIVDDAAADGGHHNPGGAWFVRQLSGLGDPAKNVSRPAVGSVGFWARTTSANLRIAIVVDDASGATGERGVGKNMLGDGKWHPYFWKLDDESQWDRWAGGDGKVDGSFTLDSIQVFGPPIASSQQSATVDIDSVTHRMPGYLPGDFNGDRVVDDADYVVFRKGLGAKYTQADYDVWRAHLGQRADVETSDDDVAVAQRTGIPEPEGVLIVILTGLAMAAFYRRCVGGERHVRSASRRS